jgi:hypothetical protein
MIFAELRGKLGADYSRAHDRAEDLYTSTVFGLLRYLPDADGLFAVLRRARPVRLAGQQVVIQPDVAWLGLERVAKVTIEFWARWGDYGEPDVVLTLWAANGAPVAVVVIEAKLYATKGGRGSDDDQAADDAADADQDQLVKYWRGLHARREVQSGAEASVIYLTRHGALPTDELGESVQRASAMGLPMMRLAWLSWRDVWAVAERLRGLRGYQLVAADLADLLAHKGFKYFNGFQAQPWQSPSTGRFWRSAPWFARLRPWRPGPTPARFWQQEAGA